mgnify:CR=1 FL=1
MRSLRGRGGQMRANTATFHVAASSLSDMTAEVIRCAWMCCAAPAPASVLRHAAQPMPRSRCAQYYAGECSMLLAWLYRVVQTNREAHYQISTSTPGQHHGRPLVRHNQKAVQGTHPPNAPLELLTRLWHRSATRQCRPSAVATSVIARRRRVL